MPAVLVTLLKYWKPLAVALAIALTFFAGMRYESAICEVEKQELIAEYTQMIQDEVDRQFAISVEYEDQIAELKKETRVIVEQVEVEVVKPIYRDCRVPESGLKLLNDTINKLNNARKE